MQEYLASLSSLGRWVWDGQIMQLPCGSISKIKNRTAITQSGSSTSGSTAFFDTGMHQENWRPISVRYLSIHVCSSIIHNSQRWTWPECPSVGEWQENVAWHTDRQTHTQEYYSPPMKFQLARGKELWNGLNNNVNVLNTFGTVVIINVARW